MMEKLLIIVCFAASSAFSAELVHYARSPQAILMGDAYTAIADDDYTLFYNPAALGEHSGLSLYMVNPSIRLTNVYSNMDKYDDLPQDDPVALTNKFIGEPLHIGAGITPGLKMGTFGISGINNMQMTFSVKNQVHPLIDMDYRMDKGFVTGFAFPFGGGKRGKKGSGQSYSVGLGLKYIKREGIKKRFPVFGTELLDKFANSDNQDITQIKKTLGYSKGRSWGVDLGFKYSKKTANSKFSYGLAVMDFGETHFKKYDGNGRIPHQPMYVNTGIAWSQDFLLFDYTLSADLSPLNAPIDFGRKVRLGAKIGIPLIDVMVGYGSGYLSYGVGVDIFLIKLYAGFYSVEVGSKFREKEDKRAIIYLSLLDFSFDV